MGGGGAESTGRLMGCYFILGITLFMYMLVPTLLQKHNSILLNIQGGGTPNRCCTDCAVLQAVTMHGQNESQQSTWNILQSQQSSHYIFLML